MKTFITMLTLIFVLFSITPDAEARKFGGKRSLGKTHNTATQNTTQQKQTTDQKATTTSQKSSKKGLMGGILGGLLIGGLFAAMMGGAFEGFQMMDFIIMAGIAFVLFKLFKAMNQAKAQAQRPAYAGEQNQFRQQQAEPATALNSAGGFAQSTNDVPFNLPSEFDLNSFLEGSRNHYKTLQQAWNDNDLSKIQEYVSNELYNELSKDRRELTSAPQTEVMFLDAQLVRAETSSDLAEISVKFAGRYRDISEDLEQDISEVWHLERQLNQDDAPWLIVGIEQ